MQVIILVSSFLWKIYLHPYYCWAIYTKWVESLKYSCGTQLWLSALEVPLYSYCVKNQAVQKRAFQSVYTQLWYGIIQCKSMSVDVLLVVEPLIVQWVMLLNFNSCGSMHKIVQTVIQLIDMGPGDALGLNFYLQSVLLSWAGRAPAGRRLSSVAYSCMCDIILILLSTGNYNKDGFTS